MTIPPRLTRGAVALRTAHGLLAFAWFVVPAVLVLLWFERSISFFGETPTEMARIDGAHLLLVAAAVAAGVPVLGLLLGGRGWIPALVMGVLVAGCCLLWRHNSLHHVPGPTVRCQEVGTCSGG